MPDTNSISSIHIEEVLYHSNGTQARGEVVYDVNLKGKLPVVIIIHEWWGPNDYAKSRARQIAELGYFEFDADLFGNGQLNAYTDTASWKDTQPFFLSVFK